MATDPYWQLEKEYTTVTDKHDLTVKAIEYKEVTRTENDKQVTDSVPCKVHEFRVKRDALCNASPVLRKLLTTGFREAEQTTVELHGDPAKTLETWFKIFHATSADLEGTDFTYLPTDLKNVWEVLATAHKYEIDPKGAKAKAWFGNWYTAQSDRQDRRFGFLEFQALIFPCHAFDYAPGFTFVTKQLVYRANGHITERRPNGFKHEHLHISSNIIRKHFPPAIRLNVSLTPILLQSSSTQPKAASRQSCTASSTIRSRPS